MASISFDITTGWWSIRYYGDPESGRVKKSLCKHPGEWSKSRPPKRPPRVVQELAAPFEDLERRARLGVETVSREVPIGPHLEAYAASAALSLRHRTVLCINNACRKFSAYCAGRGVRSLQAVTHVVCREWIEARLKEGAERSTVITERSNLMPIWSRAFQDRLIPENPWLTAKVPGKARKEVPTAWTRDEVALLLAALDGWLRDLVGLGLNTGIRIGALLSLRWEQVDWGAGLIRVRAAHSKSGKPYDVPMTPTANSILAARLAVAKHSTGGIFANPATGRPYSSRTTFTRIKRAVALVGISDHGDYNHVMRRTFATLALNSGVPMEVVQRCLGHATLGQTERAYAHLLTDRIKQGMAGFDVGGGGAALTPPQPPPSGPGTSSSPATAPPGDSAGRRPGGNRSAPPRP